MPHSQIIKDICVCCISVWSYVSPSITLQLPHQLTISSILIGQGMSSDPKNVQVFFRWNQLNIHQVTRTTFLLNVNKRSIVCVMVQIKYLQ